MPLSFLDATRQLQSKLRTCYDADEAAAIARLLLEHYTGLPYSALLAQDKTMTDAEEASWQADALQLLAGRPLQQLIGYAWFCGKKFLVNGEVLIPRPETEELVAWALDELAGSRPSVLDVGTGTGCIAISMGLALQGAEVTGVDISQTALQIAAENAEAHEVAIQLLQLDFLNRKSWTALDCYDCIVSNPPYIPRSDAATMHPNVCRYEPHTALFVPNEDPLVFYRALAACGLQCLRPGGALYCETHRDGAEAVADLFLSEGYEAIVREDLSGNPRMVRAIRVAC